MEISETGYGVDVTARRADDLDRKLITEVEKAGECTVLDLGCGAGGAAARLAAVGAYVTGMDQYDFSNDFNELVGECGKFIHGDVTSISSLINNESFDHVLCQRILHYLQYESAVALLSELIPHTKKFLYLSLSGIESYLGEAYPDKHLPVASRFSQLTPDAQETFGIYNPLVLYTKDEAVELIQTSGWCVDEVWQSAFGNIKLVVHHSE